ncbi:unnamed protein product [Toxocara canis]|uniref:PMD domain-containing protein n=1 Tax=Toxocara canis TaxID=6265 RepID=A0A183V5Q9_TOXCA|nr:unnamed protein product [Toxocara canis]
MPANLVIIPAVMQAILMDRSVALKFFGKNWRAFSRCETPCFEVSTKGGRTKHRLKCIGDQRVVFKVKLKAKYYKYYKVSQMYGQLWDLYSQAPLEKSYLLVSGHILQPGKIGKDYLVIQYIIAPSGYDPREPFVKGAQIGQLIFNIIGELENRTKIHRLNPTYQTVDGEPEKLEETAYEGDVVTDVGQQWHKRVPRATHNSFHLKDEKWGVYVYGPPELSHERAVNGCHGVLGRRQMDTRGRRSDDMEMAKTMRMNIAGGFRDDDLDRARTMRGDVVGVDKDLENCRTMKEKVDEDEQGEKSATRSVSTSSQTKTGDGGGSSDLTKRGAAPIGASKYDEADDGTIDGKATHRGGGAITGTSNSLNVGVAEGIRAQIGVAGGWGGASHKTAARTTEQQSFGGTPAQMQQSGPSDEAGAEQSEPTGQSDVSGSSARGPQGSWTAQRGRSAPADGAIKEEQSFLGGERSAYMTPGGPSGEARASQSGPAGQGGVSGGGASTTYSSSGSGGGEAEANGRDATGGSIAAGAIKEEQSFVGGARSAHMEPGDEAGAGQSQPAGQSGVSGGIASATPGGSGPEGSSTAQRGRGATADGAIKEEQSFLGGERSAYMTPGGPGDGARAGQSRPAGQGGVSGGGASTTYSSSRPGGGAAEGKGRGATGGSSAGGTMIEEQSFIGGAHSAYMAPDERGAEADHGGANTYRDERGGGGSGTKRTSGFGGGTGGSEMQSGTSGSRG